MPQSGDVLDRFLEVLVQQITVLRPEYLTGPFTVAEIYQDLVSYRSHRDLIGVEMNGDYEDALARMLSGEGDYLLLDSEVARRELQEELASLNPNTALFREFAAAEVRLHPSRVPLGAGTAPEVPAESFEVDTIYEVAGKRAGDLYMELETEVEAGAPMEVPKPPSDERAHGQRSEPVRSDEEGVVGHIETVSAPPLVSLSEPAHDRADSMEVGPGDVVTVCHWCREDLPVRDSIQFCPFCGSDLRPAPCQQCGGAMEARWQFCASCGTDVRG
jgi:hypothetical protein